MGKKKNKSGDNYSSSGLRSEEKCKQIADSLEEYIDAIDSLFILVGKNKDEVKAAVKTIKKAIKNLRNGHPEKVFSDDIEDDEEFIE